MHHVAALPNTTEEGARRRFLVRPSDYKFVEAEATRLTRSCWGFIIRIPTPRASLAVRSGPCVAVFLVRDCVYSTGPARGHDRVAAGGRSLAVSRRISVQW